MAVAELAEEGVRGSAHGGARRRNRSGGVPATTATQAPSPRACWITWTYGA